MHLGDRNTQTSPSHVLLTRITVFIRVILIRRGEAPTSSIQLPPGYQVKGASGPFVLL